ncbi:MAG TPA: EamA family transporter [Haliangiales bacterium]|nr:EamA family transporter [Haliangiales bacterium]
MKNRWVLWAAFAAVYIIWGSTYLAIRYAIETMPPLLMAGCRFVVAGSILYAVARRTAPAPTAAEWRAGALLGGLFFLGGNGGVVLAEQTVASGLVALLIATEPLFVTGLDAARTRRRPDAMRMLGLALGVAGVAVLTGPLGGGSTFGVVVVLIASLSWAVGSVYGLTAPRPRSPALAAAIPMLCGGLLLLGAGTATGEWSALSAARVSPGSLAALGYLVAFGSLLGFTAYSWLISNVSPPLVATYAFVNPAVAVVLGWAIGGEAVSPRTILGATVIVAGVVLITVGPTLFVRARAPEG